MATTSRASSTSTESTERQGHWDQRRDAHQYEQVRDASLYEEVGRPYPPPPSSGYYHSVLDRQGRALLDPRQVKPELQKGVHLSKVATSGDGSKTATLSCKAEGIPKVEYSWAKNGVGLDLNHPRYSEDTVHEGALHTSTLTIINASAALDYAIFTCTARNKLGLDVFHIQLVSTKKPEKDDKIPSPPETAETSPTEGPVLPLYLIVVLAVVGGVLLILNSALVACLVKKWRTHHSDAAGSEGKKGEGEGSSLTKPNEYGGGELLNKAARQTLLIDSCSELSSSVYESYEGDSASERGHYYYPASDFRPSLYPHQEAPECLSEGTSSFAGELKNHPSDTQ
ncbi:Nephrin [Acipenser ruthenus]|uniref:Nephrin n=1 Tax=Acipenser ruthenus TaxID=7906 RepID=A0A444V5U6_ACIRT|nr:Nephrin [Acipenser ruthenus]